MTDTANDSQNANISHTSPPDKRARLSLSIISLNEAKNIERCIRSVPFADEVVVVDSGSIDGTADLARALCARVFVEEWRGFRAQKQRATDLCQNRWVLSLDADEALSPESAKELEALLASPELESNEGYTFPRLSWNLGRWIRHGGWYPDLQLRLYDRERTSWQGGDKVHERVSAKSVKRLTHPIFHYPFPDLAEQVSTNNRYSTLGAEELAARGKRFSILKLIFKPTSKFLETYLIKRGFLDGLPGFIIAVGAAYSVFLKFAKLWETERLSSK